MCRLWWSRPKMGISQYWGFHMLKVLWRAQKPWRSYLKGFVCDDG
nr:hypothetical protein Iba_chr15eCG5370 [Ipomoea batatas]GME14836.1 hypothetical protein Iba_scaffold15503CG0080 [Ipomoea batatas]